MGFKHKTSDIQETNNKKFINDYEKNIVQNIRRYNSSKYSFTKYKQIRDSKKLTIPRINIEGECYQNLLDMGPGIFYNSYNLTSGEVEYVSGNSDYIMIRNKTRTNSILVWINVGNIIDIIKPSTKYTLVLDFYSEKYISAISTKIMGHDTQNINSFQTNMQVNKKTGRLFIPITTLSSIDKSNPQLACIYLQAHIVSMAEDDIFYFGNARLFQGTITEDQYKSNGRISGITGVGDKSRNLFNPKTVKRNVLNVDSGIIYGENDMYILSDFIQVTGGKQYVLYDEIGDSCSSRYVLEYDANKNFIKSTRLQFPKYGNRARIVLNSRASFVIVRFWCSYKDNNISNIAPPEFSPYRNIMFRKDENETCVYEPYYEGYKISIHSNNSNIFDPYNLTMGNIKGYDVSIHANSFDKIQGDIIPDNSFNMISSKNLIRIKPNTTYKVRRGVDYDGLNIQVEKIVFYDENRRSVCGRVDNYSQLSVHSSNFEFRTHNNVSFIRLVFKTTTNRNISPFDVMQCSYTVSELDITESNKSDRCDIYLDYPLLKLADWAKDEIKDGYLIRRVGKVVFNGTENWVTCNANSDEYSNYVETSISNCGPGAKIRCENLITRNDTNEDKVSSYNNTLGIMCTQGGSIRIRHREGKITAAEVREWLKGNNVTLYYELNTPVVTKIDLPGLAVFDNHTEIYTGNNLSSPKQITLPGNLYSKISANKDRLFSLKERINRLEEISLTSILNTIDIKDGEENGKI